MWQSPLKSNGFWCSFLVFGVLFGITEQTNSSVILSAIASRVSPLSGNSSLSATSTFSGRLSSASLVFTRPHASGSYYYQAIQVTTPISGTYSLTTSSSLSICGYLYDVTFDPANPTSNLLTYDDRASTGQISISYTLQSGHTYILVVTTSSSYVTGSYLLTATGSYSISLTEVTSVATTRSGYLSSSSSRFARPERSSSSYYYDSIQVTPHATGSYVFQSSSSSSLDTFGCLYRGSFNPSYPSTNKIVCDDDSGEGFQFKFTQSLSSYSTYILVVTTSSTYATGSYVVSVTGPSSVSMTSYYPDIIGLAAGIIAAIVIGSIVGCILCIGFIVLLCSCLCRQSTVTHTTVIPAQYNPSSQSVHYPSAHGNAGYAAPPPYNPYGTPYPKV